MTRTRDPTRNTWKGKGGREYIGAIFSFVTRGKAKEEGEEEGKKKRIPCLGRFLCKPVLMFCLQPASCTCARTKKAPLQRLDGPPRASPLKHRRVPDYRYIGCLANYILILYTSENCLKILEIQIVAESLNFATGCRQKL